MRMLTNQTANGYSKPLYWPGGRLDFVVGGTFDSCTVTLKSAPADLPYADRADDTQYSAVGSETTLTAAGTVACVLGEGLLTVQVSSAGGSTSIDAWIAPAEAGVKQDVHFALDSVVA